ncbi:MAG: diguanylate cyclase [Peptostreptococcaceae bacterium]|jgi:diguanylate cyclase (GGDEF)-like protein/PAS domain S-box-containing protein|nr:diguanylate cyclase [Peptostreptococcaceae bacterium]
MEILFIQDFLENLYEGVYVVDSCMNIIFWNESASRITGFKENEVLGHNCLNGPLNFLDEDGNGMYTDECILKKVATTKRIKACDIYMNHKKGHVIPVNLKAYPYINKQTNQEGTIAVFSDRNEKLMKIDKIQELTRLSFTDEITKLLNKRYGVKKIENSVKESKENETPLCAIIIEIENLSQIYYRHKSLIRDKILRRVSKTLTINSGREATVCRWNEDSFVVIIPKMNKTPCEMLSKKLENFANNSFVRISEYNIVKAKTISKTLTLKKYEDYKSFIDRIENSLKDNQNKGFIE